MVVDGYVRVSHVAGRSGETFISPSLQREQIERWASLRGALVAETFEELDESGGDWNRPLLEQAVTRVERGDSDGVVVAYMSRFGRSLMHSLLTIERITDAGGTFVSVQEGLDFSTDIGRHMLRQMLSWAEWELDRYRSSWNAARERAVARGVWMPSRPYGYRKPPGGRLEVHPEEGPIVTELFRRRAGGAPTAQLRDELMEAGVRTATGKTNWRNSTVRTLLASRRYRGEVRHGQFVNPAGHDALTDEETWQRAQQYHLENFLAGPRRTREGGLLSGILRCSGCQRVLWTTVEFRDSSFEHRVYTCCKAEFSDDCPAPVHIRDVAVEPYVERLFWQELDRPQRPVPTPRLERLRHAVDRRERELVAYRDNPSLPLTLGAERFARGLAIRTQRIEQARVEHLRAQPPDDAARLPGAPELRERWASMSLIERRFAIAQVIDPVFVRPGRATGLERIFMYRRGSGPPNLPPRHVHRRIQTRPFDPASCSATVRLRRHDKDWEEHEIEKKLLPFIADRDRWPSFREFQTAGLGALYLQVRRQLGHQAAANHYGVPFQPPAQKSSHQWSEGRVRSELQQYLAGRDEWPNRDEFIRDGRGPLRFAVRRFGGAGYWARELDIRIDRRRAHGEPWTYLRMRREVAILAAGQPDWPVRSKFVAAGMEGLYQTIWVKQARARLARDLGLRLRPVRTRWTEKAIAAALGPLLEGRDTWPTWSEFRDAGLGNLDHSLQQRGLRLEWAQRYGLRPGPSTRGHWTDDEIKAHLDPFLERRTTWPRYCEFRHAGLANVELAIRRAGSKAVWAKRYGLRPSQPAA